MRTSGRPLRWGSGSRMVFRPSMRRDLSVVRTRIMGYQSGADLAPRAPFFICYAICADAQHRLPSTPPIRLRDGHGTIISPISSCDVCDISSSIRIVLAVSGLALRNAPCSRLLEPRALARHHAALERRLARACRPAQSQELRAGSHRPRARPASADGSAEYLPLNLEELYRAQARRENVGQMRPLPLHILLARGEQPTRVAVGIHVRRVRGRQA